MDNRKLSLIMALLISAGLVMALLTDVNANSVKNAQSFSLFAHGVVDKLNSGDFAAISRAGSAQGIMVVRRQVDWRLSNTQMKNDGVNKVAETNLSLPNLPSLVWTEREIRFKRSELNGANFHFVEKQFQHFIHNTKDGYPRSTIASLNMRDTWDSRYLGPAIQGKIASNTFWYIYFVWEKGEWKIWRLEFVIH
jgi:hypothetical protein